MLPQTVLEKKRRPGIKQPNDGEQANQGAKQNQPDSRKENIKNPNECVHAEKLE